MNGLGSLMNESVLAIGTVVASHTIADFSLAGIQQATREGIDDRYHLFKQATAF